MLNHYMRSDVDVHYISLILIDDQTIIWKVYNIGFRMKIKEK